MRPGVLVASIFQIVQEQRKYTAEERAVEAMAAAQLAPGLVVEARRRMDRSWRPVWAEPELRLGVIFHPEYWAEHDAPIDTGYSSGVRSSGAKVCGQQETISPAGGCQCLISSLEVRRRGWQRGERKASTIWEGTFPQ